MGPVIGQKGKSKKQTNALPITSSDPAQFSCAGSTVGAKAISFGSCSENSDFFFPSLPVTLTEKNTSIRYIHSFAKLYLVDADLKNVGWVNLRTVTTNTEVFLRG